MIISFLLAAQFVHADFHGAPPAARKLKNPATSEDVAAGAKLFQANCAGCHGENARGTGNVPSLVKGPAQGAAPGELFWFITKGAPDEGMPPAKITERERWQVIAFIKSPPNAKISNPETSPLEAAGPPPPAPFTDFRFEKPGQVHKILARDLPPPSPDTSVANAARVVPRPENAWPKVPKGFQVELYAAGLDNPRALETAPNGDIFLAESESGKLRVFRGISDKTKSVFIEGLNRPYGIAFYPPGKNPEWVYVGCTDAILKIPYRAGDLIARGPAQKVSDLPASSRGHWTRDLRFSPDGKTLYVAVGSASNVDDSPNEKNRADILAMAPDGSGVRVYAAGIRNAGGGIAVQPKTGTLWASVNERDALGDNLVPDYITHVEEGGFYGWPWWYIGAHQDPRHAGKHPELKDKVLVPDVLLQPHHASLQMIFYEGRQFPAEYRGEIFAAQHGSWNRSIRTGYEVIRVPLHGKGKATGEYQDFMTGFVVDSRSVWGRPVGVTEMSDGSLLVSDDGSNSLWRIHYSAKTPN